MNKLSISFFENCLRELEYICLNDHLEKNEELRLINLFDSFDNKKASKNSSFLDNCFQLLIGQIDQIINKEDNSFAQFITKVKEKNSIFLSLFQNNPFTFFFLNHFEKYFKN